MMGGHLKDIRWRPLSFVSHQSFGRLLPSLAGFDRAGGFYFSRRMECVSLKVLELPRFRGHVGYAAGAGGRCCCS
jgi:hypothetical protein